jgi:hypothetical protein
MTFYAIGLMGMWLFCDGWMSLSIYLKYMPEKQSWGNDHLIRIIRIIIGVALMVIGGINAAT